MVSVLVSCGCLVAVSCGAVFVCGVVVAVSLCRAVCLFNAVLLCGCGVVAVVLCKVFKRCLTLFMWCPVLVSCCVVSCGVVCGVVEQEQENKTQ